MDFPSKFVQFHLTEYQIYSTSESWCKELSMHCILIKAIIHNEWVEENKETLLPEQYFQFKVSDEISLMVKHPKLDASEVYS